MSWKKDLAKIRGAKFPPAKVDQEKYSENWDRIDWGKKEEDKIHDHDCALLMNARHGCSCDGVKVTRDNINAV